MIAEIAATLGVLKTISGIAKDTNDVQLQSQIIDLHSKILDLQEMIQSKNEELQKLKQQLDDRSELKELKQKLKYEHNVYWLDGEPYCPTCWDDKNKQIRMGIYERVWMCQACKRSAKRPDAPPMQPVIVGNVRRGGYWDR